MIEAGEAVQRFVAGRERPDLDTDEMLFFAVVRGIEIIGEASSRVSQPTRDATPWVPWRQSATMRNRMIHAYFDISRDVVWKTATEEVPALLASLRRAIEPE